MHCRFELRFGGIIAQTDSMLPGMFHVLHAFQDRAIPILPPVRLLCIILYFRTPLRAPRETLKEDHEHTLTRDRLIIQHCYVANDRHPPLCGTYARKGGRSCPAIAPPYPAGVGT